MYQGTKLIATSLLIQVPCGRPTGDGQGPPSQLSEKRLMTRERLGTFRGDASLKYNAEFVAHSGSSITPPSMV